MFVLLDVDDSDADPDFDPAGVVKRLDSLEYQKTPTKMGLRPEAEKRKPPQPSQPPRKSKGKQGHTPRPIRDHKLLVIKKVEQFCPCPHRGCEKKFTTARACKVHLVLLHMYKKIDQIVVDVNMQRQEICPFCGEVQTTVSRHMKRAHEKEYLRQQVNLRTLL